MTPPVQNGTVALIHGQKRVFYDGYWVKTYSPPADTLHAKKTLIEALTHRLFKHVEHGIDIPGVRLKEARHAYESETDPARKRVKGAMLAGALFNRATDIFTKLFELQELGIDTDTNNPLMMECGNCLQEALSLGPMVLHRSGEESIDELWGEPFRAFSIPIDAYYESRYIKIAQTHGDIDRIADTMVNTFTQTPFFTDIGPLIRTFATAAKSRCETLSTDPEIFDIWSVFVASSEKVLACPPVVPTSPSLTEKQQIAEGHNLIQQGCRLITDVTLARTSMPKTTQKYLADCHRYATGFTHIP